MDNFPDFVDQLIADLIAFLPDLIISLIIFLVSLYLAGLASRFIKRWLLRRDVDQELTIVIGTVTRWTIYVLGTTMALNQVGFNLTAFLTGLGILGFTVGFAIQDVSKNFVAGLLLLIEQPFELGHTIEVKGFHGTVLKVQLRATELRTVDGLIVQIPNSDVFTNPITNYTRAHSRRIHLKAGVAYGTDVALARRVALEAVGVVEGVQSEPAPMLVFDNLGPSTLDFTLYYWVDTTRADYQASIDAGILAVNQAFDGAGVEMPYPTQVVMVQQG